MKVSKYLKRECEEERARLFLVVPGDRMRGSGHICKHRVCFPLNIWKQFVAVKVNKHWHRLPEKVVKFPFLETVKSRIHTAPEICLCVALLEQRGCAK